MGVCALIWSLYSYRLSARGPDAPPGVQYEGTFRTWRHLATNTHSANCKWRTIYINVSQHRNSIKCVSCSHRNNLILDSAHYRDPCNIPAEREGDRVKGLRDIRETDIITGRQTDSEIIAEFVDM